MINTQEEARQWLLDVQVSTQRAKSILLESMGQTGVTIRVINDLQPGLLEQDGKIDLVTMTDRYLSKKAALTRTDIMSVMLYVNKCAAVELEMRLRGVFICNPMDITRSSKLPLME